MKSLDQVVDTLTANKSILFTRYPIKELGVFGSYVHGTHTKSSDIDILVDFSTPVSMFKFLELEDHLSSLLGEPVDLVMKAALKKNIGKTVLDSLIKV